MSIQLEWPKSGWPDEVNESVRASLEKAIRQAMNSNNNNTNGGNNNNNSTQTDKRQKELQQQQAARKGDNNKLGNVADDDEDQEEEQPLSSLMRGVVSVDGLSLGKVAPNIVLKKITDLSPGRSGLLVHVEYKGDAWVSVRGIEINLDPTRVFVSGGGGLSGGRKAEVVAPLFCPLTLKLSDLHLCGDLKVEVLHEVKKVRTTNKKKKKQQQEEDLLLSSPNDDHGDLDEDEEEDNDDDDESNGYYDHSQHLIPDTFTEVFLGKLPSSNHQQHPNQSTMNDKNNNTLNKKVEYSRRLFIQLMSEEEFVQDFNVDSNFGAVPQAVEKIKGTIRTAVRPLFQKLRSQGMSVQL